MSGYTSGGGHSVRGVTASRKPDETDCCLINALQGGFPLVTQPYAAVGEALGLSEAEVIMRLQSLLDDRILTRFGPMFQIEQMGGAFCLAAMIVPEAAWDETVAAVNAFAEVAHNYRRESVFNMWFVLATETPDSIERTAHAITAETGLTVYLFPKEREYFVEMKLEAR